MGMAKVKESVNNLVVDDLRIKRLKDQLMNTPQELDMERIKALMSSYKETEGLPSITRRARFYEKLLITKKLYIDENLLVGAMASAPLHIYAHPEWNVDWMKADMKAVSHLGEIEVSDEQKEMYKEVIEYWDGKTLNDRANKLFEEKYGVNPLLSQMTGQFFGATTWPGGGGCLDYKLVLTKGIKGIIEDIQERLDALPLTNVDGQNKKILFYENALISLKAVVSWANRYAQLAKEMAEKEENPAKKEELLEIVQICEWVPENPPRTFREAVQSVFFAHMAVEIEQVGCGNSFGYLGQHLEPYYQKDKAAGIINEDQAVYLLQMFYIKCQEIGYYFGQEFRNANSSDLGQTITIGGLTPEGRDATADVDYLMLDAQIGLKNIQPTFALMYHNNLKEDFLAKAVDCVKKTGLGQPQFMNTEIMVQRLLDQHGKDGATLGEARRGAVAGCVSTMIAKKTSHHLEGAFCVAKQLELALNDGKDPLTGHQVGLKTGAAASFETYEQLYDAFLKQMEYGVQLGRDHGKIGCMLAEEMLPFLFRSVLTGGCIESGKDCWAGGAKYDTVVNVINGVVDTANSLAAVKKLVFDEKKLTMAELMEVLEANFEGHEKIKKMCLKAPKHGNDDPEMTALVRKIYDDYLPLYHKAGPCYMGKEGKPDAYSKSLHNMNGAVMGALPCGREARVALTDGSVSAMPGSDVNGPTALANSAALAQDPVAWTSSHLNMKFHPSSLEGAAGTRNMLAIIKGYMEKGGSHVQFNSVKSETLKEAQVEPEKHRDLVIRVAGFSAYFTCLDKGVQDEIVKRTELNFA